MVRIEVASSAATGDGALIVRDTRVEGLRRISEGTVHEYLPLNIGDRPDGHRMTEAIRALYATGFFSRGKKWLAPFGLFRSSDAAPCGSSARPFKISATTWNAFRS